eukprot:scaffold305396_cov21-Prasinocladus_malaysianus.AAC.1
MARTGPRAAAIAAGRVSPVTARRTCDLRSRTSPNTANNISKDVDDINNIRTCTGMSDCVLLTLIRRYGYATVTHANCTQVWHNQTTLSTALRRCCLLPPCWALTDIGPARKQNTI